MKTMLSLIAKEVLLVWLTKEDILTRHNFISHYKQHHGWIINMLLLGEDILIVGFCSRSVILHQVRLRLKGGKRTLPSIKPYIFCTKFRTIFTPSYLLTLARSFHQKFLNFERCKNIYTKYLLNLFFIILFYY